METPSGTSRFYGYLSDLQGSTLQLSSARLAEILTNCHNHENMSKTAISYVCPKLSDFGQKVGPGTGQSDGRPVLLFPTRQKRTISIWGSQASGGSYCFAD